MGAYLPSSSLLKDRAVPARTFSSTIALSAASRRYGAIFIE
jgi:hypothetical protein